MSKYLRYIFIVGFVIYLVFMLWLMFFQRQPTYNYMINLIPFDTINMMIDYLSSPYRFNVIYALENLFGNIVLFAPIGVFLPAIWKKQRTFRVFFVTSALSIITAEAIQYFTCLGMADIDDLLLNMIGAVAGFYFFRFFYNKFLYKFI